MGSERAVVFDCGGDALMGILHEEEATNDTVVVFVVGGPQYRVGSHRMFVELARALAASGNPVLRFDCRGMGDSDGQFNSFEDLSLDIRSAIDVALRESGCSRAAVLGLCDGASACAMYAGEDRRVSALVLLNPWVRTEAGEARTRVRHYYAKRLLQWELWRRVFRGKVNLARSIEGFIESVKGVLRQSPPTQGFIDRMLQGLSSFEGATLFVLAGADLTANEFRDFVRSSSAWRRLLDGDHVHTVSIADADHTFSDVRDLECVATRVAAWLDASSGVPGENGLHAGRTA